MNAMAPTTSLIDRVAMADVYIALAAALAVLLVFSVAVFVQKRMPAVTVTAVPDSAAMTGVVESLERLTANVGAIEQRQISDEQRLMATEHSVNNIRAALGALPDKDTVHRLEVDITKLGGRVGAIEGTTEATQRGVERIENFLLNGATSRP